MARPIWAMMPILLIALIVVIAGYAQSPPAVPGAVPEGMAAVPGGTFSMGCVRGDSSCNQMEKPRHQVNVKPFLMDAREVTQAQYEKVAGENPSTLKNCPDCPVEGVTWNEAQSYCLKVGKKLPTEAEWEFAARGGKDGQIRYGDMEAISWYRGNSANKPHPVGLKAPNAYGLYDMLGNVGEWCSDWYGEYSSAAADNPTGPTSGATHVLRGGAFNLDPQSVRASYRDVPSAGQWYYPVGFRCVQR